MKIVVNFTLVHCSLNDSFQTRPRLGTLTGTFPFSLLQDKTPKLIFYKSNPSNSGNSTEAFNSNTIPLHTSLVRTPRSGLDVCLV